MNNNPHQFCPSCGYTIEEHTSLDNTSAKPRPNNLTLCFNCAIVLQFDENLKVKLPPIELIGSLDEETTLQISKVQDAILRMRGKKK